jgi:Na+/melibiose symporter-like transporter
MADERRTGPRAVWKIPAWRLAFPAAVISRLGDLVFDITVVLWVSTDIAAGRSWAPLAVSGVLLAAVAPVLLIGPAAGVFTDRMDRHRLMVRSNWVQTIAIGSLVLIPALGGQLSVPVRLTWIYLVLFVSNAAGQFFGQARMAMIVKTIPDELLTTATSMQGSANSILSITGPPLAAPLLFTAGVTWALAINALSFLASSILLGRTVWDSAPEPGAAGEGFWRALNEGRKAIAANRVLLAIAVSGTMVVLALGATTVLEVFFVTGVLHERASLLGILLGGFAVGTLVGAVAAPWLERRAGAPALYVWGVIVAGLAMVAFSRTTSFAPAVILYAAAGIPVGLLNTVLSPLGLRTVPPDQLGRAIAFLNIFPTVAELVATGLAGWLVSSVLRGLHVTVAGMTFGPVDTVFTAAGLVLLAVGIAVWRPIFAARVQAAPAAPAPSAQ